MLKESCPKPDKVIHVYNNLQTIKLKCFAGNDTVVCKVNDGNYISPMQYFIFMGK